MRKLKTGIAFLSILAGTLVLTGFGSKRTEPAANNTVASVARYVAVLKTGSAQQKAAAAYWLGQQRSSASEAVTSMVSLLGDTSEIDPSRYRRAAKDFKVTLGEEVAEALVQIGRPAIEPLIHVLKTSPSPEARKNAARALGGIQSTATSEGPAV